MTAPAAPYCPTWSLHAWKPVFCRLDRISSLRLRHLGTQVTQQREVSQRAQADPGTWTAGLTMWAAHLPDCGDVGLAWHWMLDERRGDVLLRDLFGIVTNLRLCTATDEVLPAFHAMRHHGDLIRALPWTDRVLQTCHPAPVWAAAA